MNTTSLDEIVNITLAAGGNGGEEKVNLPDAVLAGITVTDDMGNTPKNVNIELLKNSNPVVKARHIDHFRRATGGNYMDRIMPLWFAVNGTYQIRVTHDTENLAENHNLQVEFKIVPKDQLHLYKN